MLLQIRKGFEKSISHIYSYEQQIDDLQNWSKYCMHIL